jgi:hypothetical protein
LKAAEGENHGAGLEGALLAAFEFLEVAGGDTRVGDALESSQKECFQLQASLSLLQGSFNPFQVGWRTGNFLCSGGGQ